MKRRDFLVFLGSSLVANPMAATGQKVTPSRIGFLRVGPPPPTYIGGFREGLQEQGLVEGRDFVIEYALAQSAAQIPETAVQLAVPLRYYAIVIGTIGTGFGLLGIAQGLRILLLILAKVAIVPP
jgi:hypothetical protein